MNAVTLSELGPVIAAVLAPMLAFVVVSMRYQHLDGVKTREAISKSEKETRALISESSKETREMLGAQLAEHKSDTQESLRGLAASVRDLGVSLGDARERLARIEGHFGIGAARSQDEAGEDSADAA